MSRPLLAVLLLSPALAACAKADTRGDAGPMIDAAPPVIDARADAGPCSLVWYADDDGDGYGDPGSSVVECGGQPAGHVANDNDCDDTTVWRQPGLPEWCDGLDNDCSAGSSETCPSGCVVRTSGAEVYLFCSVATGWSSARTTCLGQQMRPVRVDDATENGWLRSTADSAIGAVVVWLGGSDSVEGTWKWDDGDQYWAGASGGAPVNGLYANWLAGEPNDNGGAEDCAELRTDGKWNDTACGGTEAYVCERYELSPP
ncbi:MAG TPA: lectin-like protein [Kofleriaceae bacterium]|nr:lectin-like protein [Kofleriaceae bacterium]